MKKKLVLILLALVCVICCAFGLSACSFGGGGDGGKKDDDGGVSKDEVKNAKDVEMGFTHAQVKEILGEPYVAFGEDKDNREWKYYDTSYISISTQMDKKNEELVNALLDGNADKATKLTNEILKLEQQLEILTYKYIEIKFDAVKEGNTTVYKVCDVLYDSVCNNSLITPIPKIVEQLKLSDVPALADMRYTRVEAKITYTDGSYRNTLLSTSVTANVNTFSNILTEISWSDSWGTYKKYVNVTSAIAEGTVITGTFGTGTFTATALAEGTIADIPDFSAVIESESAVLGEEGDYVMWNNIDRFVKDITISKGITEIKENCFDTLGRLESVTLPEGFTTLEENAFRNCNKLSAYTIDIYFVSRLPRENLKEVNITLTGENEIRVYAFKNCTTLEKVTLGEGITRIGDEAFFGCEALVSVNIPESVTFIGPNSFNGCKSLTEIVIPDTVTTLGYGSFKDCASLTAVTLPANRTVISAQLFMGCTSLETVEIPQNTTAIYANAFNGCTSLTDITIPAGVTEIGDNAFRLCRSLKNITLPGGITALSEGLFACCYLLENVTIPEGVTEIGKEAFLACNAFTEITIPDGVTEIGNSAFKECRALEKITIPESVTRISSDAFKYCSALENITLPEGLTYLGEGVFSHTPITSMTIPEGINEVSYYLFEYCSELTEVNLPKNLHSVMPYSFRGCTALESLVIPETDYSYFWIGDEAFYGCSALKTIVLPADIRTIYEKAFAFCTALTAVYYRGTAETWAVINIEERNDLLTDEVLYFYSKTQPEASGNFWRFDEDGITPVEW